MTYHDEHIQEYRLMRNAILDEVTDAAGESTKIPRLQRALQEFDENFDVIGLINFNWDHTRNKPLSIDNRYYREHRVPQSKSTIIKNKHAIRYLAGQEEMCRLSDMAQRITPQLLQLRQRDQDSAREGVLSHLVLVADSGTPPGHMSIGNMFACCSSEQNMSKIWVDK